MKKYPILMILAISLFAFSCGDDDDAGKVKCLKCIGSDEICVGDDDGSGGTLDEPTLQALADFANALGDGTCTFK
jgi:hypothetical protein